MNIGQLYEEIRSYKKSRTITTALHFGVLSAIGNSDISFDELCCKLAVADKWLQMIFNVLISVGIIEESRGRYSLTNFGIEVDQSLALRSFANYHYYCFDSWQKLPERLVSGESGNFHFHIRADKDFCHAYLMSMDQISVSNMPFIEKECEGYLNGSVFDVGAGPASFCRHLANQNSKMNVTAIDYPEIVARARELFMSPDNFEWVGVDFLDWTPLHTANTVFCSHLLEYCSKNMRLLWLSKLNSFLKKKGYLILVLFLRESISQDNTDLDLFEMSTGLNGTQLGYLQTSEEIQKILTDSGFKIIKLKPIPRGPSYPEFLIVCQL